MPVSKDILLSTLQASFPQAEIAVKSLTGDDDHWEVTVKNRDFEGKNRIIQHRLVQDALKHLNIHAVSIKTSAN